MIRPIALLVACLVALLLVVFWWKGVGLKPLDDAARADLQKRGLAHQFATVPSGSIHYQLTGPPDGEVVLLIHGFSAPMFVWDGVAANLAASGYRVLAFDGYGRGFSSRPDTVYDESLIDTEIVQLLAHLNVRRPIHVVGYSAGGVSAAVFAERHPSQTATLTLIAPGGLAPKRPLPVGPFRIPGVEPWFGRVVAPGLFQKFFTKTLVGLPNADLLKTAMAQQFRYVGAGPAMTSIVLHYPVTGAGNLYAAAAATGVPTLLLWGEADTTAPFAWSKAMQRLMPAARLVSFEHQEHNIVYARPDLVSGRLRSFLKAEPLPTVEPAHGVIP